MDFLLCNTIALKIRFQLGKKFYKNLAFDTNVRELYLTWGEDGFVRPPRGVVVGLIVLGRSGGTRGSVEAAARRNSYGEEVILVFLFSS